MSPTPEFANPPDSKDAELSRHFSAIVESSDDAILSKDMNGTILSWNRAAQKIFGYTSLEAIGKSVTMLIPPGHEDEEPNILARIRRGEKVDHYETVRQRKDGALVNVSLTVSPIKDASGKVIGASKIARDITSQRRSDELQFHFSAIVESSDDAILSKDINGTILSWNRAAQKIFGYTSLEAIGKSVTMLIPPGHEDEEPNILARIRRGEQVDHYETVRQRKNGSLVNVSLTVSPIRDASGKVIGASKIARDITAQKKNEELKLHFLAIVESSDDAILSKDLNGTILSWNRAAQKIFGYTSLEAIGKSVTMLIPPGHEDEEPNILARIRRGEKIDHYETVRRRKDGALVNVSLTVSPIKDASGNVIGASKIARDITVQRRTQNEIEKTKEELAELNRNLERRVKERTASLNEAMNQMEEFSYSVSHDLRSPARAMQAYAKALLEDCGQALDSEGKDYLNKIIRGSARMDKLIQDVLTYSRLARTQIQVAPVYVEPLVQDIIQQYPELQSPRAKFSIASPLENVLAHEALLAQALANLFGNAVKFVAPGVIPHVKVRSERRDKMVRFWIKDNGIGIHRDLQSRLFGLFERVNESSGYEGTGVGLAIVRKAVEKMGGHVGLESNGTGASFWIELAAVSA